jgi:RimJ/RimL family protein N-acetyltransferase
MATDKSSLIANANNHRVWRNLADVFPHPYTEADADHWLSIANSPARSIHFAIEYAGEAVGGVGARAGEGIFVRTAQFGYWLGEPYWGRGIMTVAAGAMLEHLKRDARFARLEAPVFEWNPASMRVLDKLGFVREAVKRNSVTKDGQLIDSVLYTYLIKP